jgi:predicted membrane protein
MTLIDIVLAVCGAWLCFNLGRIYQTHVMMRRLISNVKEIQDLLESTEPEPVDEDVEIRAEWVGSQVYLYVKSNDEFLAQGPDLDTALERIAHGRKGRYVLAEKAVSAQP